MQRAEAGEAGPSNGAFYTIHAHAGGGGAGGVNNVLCFSIVSGYILLVRGHEDAAGCCLHEHGVGCNLRACRS